MLQLGLDQYGTLRLINYIRREVGAGKDPRPSLRVAELAAQAASQGPRSPAEALPWADDAFLTPVLAEDPLLCYDYEGDAWSEDEDMADASAAGMAAQRAGPAAPGLGPSSSGSDEAAQLRVQVSSQRARVSAGTGMHAHACMW